MIKKQPERYRPNKYEKIILGLTAVVVSKDRNGLDKQSAQSLIDWYMKSQRFSDKQQAFANVLINKKCSKKKTDKEKKYYLYAVTDGKNTKLGVSVNPKERLRNLQSSHPETLQLVWTFYVGKDKSLAYKQEKKLHRFCRQYSKRGEWFEGGVMKKVEAFNNQAKNLQLKSEAVRDRPIAVVSGIIII